MDTERRISGELPVLDLPTDRPRTAQNNYRGATQNLALPRALTAALRRLGQREESTLDIVLLAGFQALLYRYANQTDLMVGLPVADQALVQVVRCDLSGNPGFRELLGQVRAGVMAAQAHQAVPVEQLADALRVAFALQDSPSAPLARSVLAFDLTLSLAEVEAGLVGALTYNANLFDAATMERLAGHFQRLMASAAADPDQPIASLGMLSEGERHQLLVGWNETATRYPDTLLIHELVAARAAETPDVVAVAFGQERLTYGELDRRANQLAAYLRRIGLGPEKLVGVCIERSPALLVALLGTLKAGAAYVAIDPSYPRERIAYMLADAQVGMLLTREGLCRQMPDRGIPLFCMDTDWVSVANENHAAPPPLAGAANLAYIIYTSGSTGRPKGVMIEHRSLLNLVYWYQRTVGLTAGDRTTQTAGVAFDAAVVEIWPSLAAGATIYLPDEETRLSPPRLRDWLVTNQITVGFLATPLAEQVLPLEWPAHTALRFLLTGGEKLKTYPPAGLPFQLIDAYGPAEATVVTTLAFVPTQAGQKVAPAIGRPIANAHVFLLDRLLQPVPVGVIGELYIGGSGLARGYLNQPGLTAERFLETEYGRLYRTGDLARYLPDGSLEFAGRSDFQVKIRGFRIELGEIETMLKRADGVRGAVVIAREGPSGDKQLIAYVVPEEGRPLKAETLRAFLKQQLPDYMVPAAFVLLDELPLTPNGKVDRRALPAPELPAEEYVAPRTPLEEALAAIWRAVLGVKRVGIHDNFFALGGHSLLATRITAQVCTALGVELKAASLFAAPTVAELAVVVDQARQQEGGRLIPPPTAVPRDLPLPLSFAQQRLWFLDQLEPGSPFYHIPAAWRVTGRLDLPLLEQSLAALVARHEALRTTFAREEGEPVQVIRPSADVPMALVDLTLLSGAAQEAELHQALRREAVRPFDLTAGPLLRALLVRLAPEEHVLLLTIHHIVADGWSMGVLLGELATLYETFAAGRPSPLAPLAIQYADYAVWQRAWLEGGETARQLAYWQERMAGAPAMLELPTDRPRPAVQTFHGALLPIALPAELARRLALLSRGEGATLFMALLAGFQALLARLSGQTDVVVGAPVAGRTRTETEALIGFFVNTLPHRADLSDDPTFRELLWRVREGALDAFSHQDLPLQHLVEELQPDRDLSHSPLFQVVFALQNDLAAAKELSGLTFVPFTVDSGTAKFDLALTLEDTPEGLVGGVEYNTDLFDRSSVERMMGSFQRLLTEAVEDPDSRIGALNLLSADERRQILVDWNDTAAPYPATLLIHELVAARAAENPERVAVVWGEERLTYAELDCRANQVAHYLRRTGLGPDKLVGVCMERSPALLVALLGTLKAGAAYLPIDPAYPPERIAYMLADAAVGVLLTQERLGSQIPAASVPVVCLDSGWAAIAAESQAAPESLAGPDSLAYMIYTSGSTGRPKGVMIEHRALLNLVYWHQSAFALTAADRTTQIAGIAFDAAVWEIWPSLAAGATLYLPDEETRLTPARLRDWLVTNQITVSFLATPLAEQILTLKWPEETALRFLLTGGDQLHLYPPAGLPFQLINCYGPTESTVVATAATVVAQAGTTAAPPIGRPIANTRVYLLDPSLQPTPVGVIGELYIGGSSLARGYLNRPDLTAERFLETPYGRLYRTGDLARYRPDGAIEYVGRSDHQVKIRGFRIELGEIETLLTNDDAVQAAVVVAREEQPGRKQLVAYVVPEKGHLVTLEALRLFLKQQLPDYMVPAAFVILADLPLTPNGKIDRRALPAPDPLTASEAYAPPRTSLEAVLTGIWSEVLGGARVGIDDNFFELGGHSLLAVKLIARIQAEFGVELPLRALFTHPTVAELAPVIADSAPDAATAAPPTGIHADAQAVGPAPLSSAQRRLWFLDQFEPGSAVYNVPFALRLTGSLDVDALAESLNAIVQRHEALRTTFAAGEGGEPVQIVAPRIELPLPLTDLSDYPDPESEALDRARAEACRPFDLGTGPLLRAALLRLEPGDHLLLLNLHHIVADVLSMGVLFHEFAVFYRAHAEGSPAVLPRLAMQYPEYARWQRQRLQGDRLEPQLAYWQQRLAGVPTALDLPTDRPRPPVKTYAGANLRTQFTPVLAAALQRLSRQEGVTLYMTLLAAFQVLLRRYSGQTDLCVGTPVAGRPRQELEELIGVFISTLVMRTDLSGNPSFRELLAQVRENVLGDFAHQELPFEHLVEALQPVRDTSRSPLFQVMFAAQNTPAVAMELPGLTVRTFEVENGTAKFDLTLHIAQEGGAVTATMEYNTDLFNRATMERMMGHYLTMLEAAVGDPDQPVESLALLPAAERRLILEQWCQTGPGRADGQTIAALLNEQIRRLPSATALIYEEQRFTYAELHQRANRLAHYLQSQGVGPDVLVGVSLPRSPELVIALLAVVKAGGAYVPLDPNYPAERLAYMIAESGLRLVIDPAWLERNAAAIAACPGRNPTVALAPENLIYVIYTSGSTGRPKGVAITHRSVAELIHWVRANYTDEELSGVLFATSVSFDISVFELFGTLCWGGALILAENALGLPALPAAHEVRLINTVPSAASELVRQQALPPSVITVNLCGEALPRSLARDLYALPHIRKVVNLYGPTEDTVYSTCTVVDRETEQAPSIGRALPGTRVYILDSHLQPVPCGVAGELYLGGRGLARGYLNRPELTAERFPMTEFGRLYRTGDLVRWLPDGQIEFLGRIDHQVKIRGFRIELGEVQETLLTHPAVQEAVVVARPDSGDLRLVAYFAAESDLTVQELRALLGKRLPEYMIPSAFVRLAELPHTPNGKVDRKALPAPEWEQPSASVAPRTKAEERLAALWCAVLHLKAVGVEENFFELGGHSLLAAQLITRIRSEFGMELPLRAIFAHPTVAELAAAIAGPVPEPVPEAEPEAPTPEVGPAPLSFAQRRLWFLDQFEPGSPYYNVPAALRLTGTLNADALARSLNAIVQRHEVLRTTFATGEDGEPMQIVAPVLHLPLPLIDLSDRPNPEAEAMNAARAEGVRPFDLSTGPLIRTLLLRLGPTDHLLLLTLHHIVSDLWSFGVLLQELGLFYRAQTEGKLAALPPLAMQVRDYARWEREGLQGDRLASALAYWQQRMAGAPAALDLPTDRPRPPVKTYSGDYCRTRFAADLAGKLHKLSRREGATLYMTLLAAFQVLLRRYSGQTDLCVGTPVAGRPRQEMEALIGAFVSTLVIRTDLAGNPSFRELLGQVRENLFNDFEHQDLPFENLVEALQPVRDTSRTPLFQVMFSMQNAPRAAVEFPGLTVRTVDLETGTAKFDLTLFVEDGPDGLTGMMEYNTDLFDRATIERMLGHYLTLLEAAVADPDMPVESLALLPAAEQRLILEQWSQTGPGRADGQTVAAMLAAQARQTPSATALIYDTQRFTYAELEQRTNRLAHYLQSLGVGPDVLVGVSLPRTPDLVFALHAVVKAGGAYVPLDPNYPAERLAYMIEDSGLRLVIDSAWLECNAAAIAACPASTPAVALDPENLIYVIYTSGSTGRPKGVAITHRSVAELLYWVRANYTDEELAGVLLSTSVSFDISIFELFGTPCWGGAMILAENALQLPALPAAHAVRLINTAPSAGAELARQKAIPPSVITVNLCGEALTRSLARDLYGFPNVRKVVNLYGPTEDTVYSTWTVVDREGEQAPSIGRALPGTRVYILDAHLQPVPCGVAGELYLGGRGLARGYLHRPELTAERFPTTAFGRLYRTGDLVRWLPDGQMEFLGRIDHQVKIRGFRIELGEVQETLLTHPAVKEAVVVARQDLPGDLRLVAYFAAEGSLTVQELRALLGKRLPEYMIPSAFVQLAALPHTPNGKVDRKALPAPEREEPSASVAPHTPAEERMAALWCAVLHLETVGVADDFFELGGHSLLAAQLISRIRTEFGVDLPLRAIFAHPTVAALAATVGAAAEAPRSSAAALLPAEEPALRPVESALTARGPAPLSFAQRRIWFLDQFEPGSSFYNMPGALRLTGRLNVGALAASLNAIVQRHEALRTTFAAGADGEPVQVVAPFLHLPLPLIDVADRPDPEAEALALARAEAAQPFDLSAGPLIRATLLRLGAEHHLLVLTLHHIVADLWSMGVLADELAALYRQMAEGKPASLPALPVQVGDYARWQRQWLQGARLEAQLAYWQQRMAGAPSLLDLPTDRPRPAVKTYAGATCRFCLPADLVGALNQLSRQEGATLYMTLLAAFQVLLYRYSGQTEICVGTPVAGRSRQELERLIGVFVSTLVMRTAIESDRSFRELLAQVRENVLNDFSHQDLPFETLVEALQPVRDTSRSPLFQVMFSLQNTPMGSMALPGLTIDEVAVETGTAKFDLTLYLTEERGGLTGIMEYNTDLFDRATIVRLIGHLETLLAGIAANPQTPVAGLPLLTTAESSQIMGEWNDTAVAYRQNVCLHELIEEQVERTPEATAVLFAGEPVSYRELNRRANQLAHGLRKLGVGPDVLVGICMERSVELVVGLLAILKAGGAYVPLDPTYPQDRLAFMLADTAVPVLLTQERLVAGLPAHEARVICLETGWSAMARESDANPVSGAGPSDTAYVIFTSGSTGRPKGVMVPHAGICNRLLWMQDAYQLTAADRVMQKTPFSFDVSVWEFFWPLMTGATLVVAQPEGHKDSQYLVKLIQEARVTTMHFVPSMLQIFTEEPDLGHCESLRQVMCSGEALPPDVVERFYGRAPAHVLLHNLYGPTEASVDVTYWACPREEKLESVPIGRPIANTQIYLLNEQLQPVPVGVAGELHIGGVGLARGYLKRPDLTAEKFIPNPFGPGRLYKTGDLARYRPDGAIEYLGRIDHQVKIRGFRIELGEIESLLQRHGGLKECVVVAREDVPGQKQLVAYGVPGSTPVTVGELREFLRASLPEYMVPAHFVLLEAMPLSPNGKLDRKALPAPQRAVSAAGATAPRTVQELQLLPVWESVLGVSPIGVEENFFALGGHSLLVIRLLNAVREATGRQLPIASLFRGPTIASQAKLLEQEEGDEPWTPLVPIRATGTRPPFYCAHGAFGSVFCFADLARELGPDQPFYGLQPRGLYDEQPPLHTMPEMAARYVEAIREVQPHGPYFLGGYCMGGLIAQEMARLLTAAGEAVALVAMLDTKLPQPGALNICADEDSFLRSFAYHEGWDAMTPAEQWADAFSQTEQEGGILPPGITTVADYRRWFRMYRANIEANVVYKLAWAPGKVFQFLALEQPGDPLLGWQGLADRLQIVPVPGNHESMLEPPHVRELAAQLRAVLDQASDNKKEMA